ncbi:hypothetical protein HanPI659440_Chr09g0323741 [Helianthus annuus]|nr:hypothetical protein HanPI659440_Chr09g0323741 [Helianthus annuus]
MGEEIMEFKNAEKIISAEKEAFDSEKKGLLWRVANVEEKLAKEQKLNVDRQKDWTAACEGSNREFKAAWDEVVRVNDERAKEIREFDRLSAAYKEKEAEALAARKSNEEARARVVELEKTIEDQQAQNKTLELLAQDLGDDCKWLLTHGVPLASIADRLVRSEELIKYMFDLGDATYNSGLKDGYSEGKAAELARTKEDKFDLFKVDCAGNYIGSVKSSDL